MKRIGAQLQPWNGRDAWKPPEPYEPGRELGEFLLLDLLPDPRQPDRLGIGAAILGHRRMVLRAWLVVHEACEVEERATIEAWARKNPLSTLLGPRSWRVLDRCEFNRLALLRFGYRGRASVVGAHLGRSLALLAATDDARPERRWKPSIGRNRGGWTLGLAGLGRYGNWTNTKGKTSRTWRPTTWHYPQIKVRALGRAGLWAGWTGCPKDPKTGQRCGQVDRDGLPYRGRFVELVGLASALDGSPSDDLDVHLEAFGLAGLGDDFACPGEQAAKLAAERVLVVRDLALALDDDANRWLQHGLGVDSVFGGGRLADRLAASRGLIAPLAKSSLGDDELARWAGAMHGARVDAPFPPVPFPAVDIDLRSAYPTAAILNGTWAVASAALIDSEDCTYELVELLARPEFEGLLYDPATWRRWGLCLVELIPDGDLLPIAPGRDGRLVLAPIHGTEPLPFVFGHLAAAVLAGGGLRGRVIRASRIVGHGRQEGLRGGRIYGDLGLPVGRDPTAALVEYRSAVKAVGDKRLAASLRVAMNSTPWIYGKGAEFHNVGGSKVPAPWCFPPFAASAVGTCAALVAMAEAEIVRLGGAIAATDTDGLTFPASPEGGTIELPDGSTLRAPSWSEIDTVLDRFEALNPYADGGRLFSVERGTADDPLYAIVWGPKRYVLGRLRSGAFEATHVEHVGPDAPGLAVVESDALGGKRAPKRRGVHRQVPRGPVVGCRVDVLAVDDPRLAGPEAHDRRTFELVFAVGQDGGSQGRSRFDFARFAGAGDGGWGAAARRDVGRGCGAWAGDAGGARWC
jgi:hypothetical protein